VTPATLLTEMYQAMLGHFGPRNWWPAKTPFEVAVGAVLTQNTNWQNVTRAIDNLRSRNLLSYEALLLMPIDQLAKCIRPAGYYNLKALRLKNLLGMLAERYNGDLRALFDEPLRTAREHLLAVKGIGAETADSILLYGGNLPIFVVDAYTHRILHRHAMIGETSDYQSIQELFMDNLPPDPGLFNEYHALLVQTGKYFCLKKKARCQGCPLNCFLENPVA
jgi:endonuclease-3 related protein